MSCLDATFTLTPLSPFYGDASGRNVAGLYCFGADFWIYSPNDLSSLYASNRFFFDSSLAADPNLNYAQWANLMKTQHLQCFINLSGYAKANKQLALIFGFGVQLTSGPTARVLVYSNAGLLQDQQLVYGDNQFLLEIESLDQQLILYFIHARNKGSVAGGDWFFTGLSGYVV